MATSPGSHEDWGPLYGEPNGIAPLDASSKVPVANLPASIGGEPVPSVPAPLTAAGVLAVDTLNRVNSAGAGGLTFQLPSAPLSPGKRVLVWDYLGESRGANKVVIIGMAGQTISRLASYQLGRDEFRVFRSDGVNWGAQGI